MNDDTRKLTVAALTACVNAMTPANNDEEAQAVSQAHEALKALENDA